MTLVPDSLAPTRAHVGLIFILLAAPVAGQTPGVKARRRGDRPSRIGEVQGIARKGRRCRVQNGLCATGQYGTESAGMAAVGRGAVDGVSLTTTG